MLRVTVNDKPRGVTFRIEGGLAGPWVQVLDRCWQSVLARRIEPTVCVDLSGVTFIDEAGKACLAALYRLGAEFLTADCVTKAVLDEIAEAEQLASRMLSNGDPLS
jgi:anti-anti-sigma regulatory factor